MVELTHNFFHYQIIIMVLEHLLQSFAVVFLLHCHVSAVFLYALFLERNFCERMYNKINKIESINISAFIYNLEMSLQFKFHLLFA